MFVNGEYHKASHSFFPIKTLVLGLIFGVFLRAIHSQSTPSSPWNRKVTLGPLPADQKNTLKALINSKMYFHIAGDAFGGSDLDGLPSMEMPAQFLDKYANFASEELKKDIQSITQNLYYTTNASSVQSCVSQLAFTIRNLPMGKSIWVEGGWISSSAGHAMLYEFRSQQDGLYDIFIYNTGAGSEFHYSPPTHRQSITLVQNAHLSPSMLDTELKNEEYIVCPFVKFKDVPLDTIIHFNRTNVDSPFLFNLVRLTNEESHKDNPAEIIYKEIFGPLNNYRVVNPSREPEYFVDTPQHSGTCAWRVVFYAALKKQMSDSDSHHMLKIELQKAAFDTYCDLDQMAWDKTQRRLCLVTGQKMLREISQLYPEFLDKNATLEYQASVLTRLDFLQSGEEKPFSLKKVSYAKNPGLDHYNLPVHKPPSRRSVEAKVSFSGPLSFERISSLIHALKEIENFPRTEIEDLSFQINRVAKALCPPAKLHTLWPDATKKELLTCQKQLTLMLVFYEQLQPNIPQRLVEKNTAWMLLATVHEIAMRLHPELKEYTVYYESFQSLINMPTFMISSLEDWNLYKEIIAYFESFKKEDNILFDIQKRKTDAYLCMETPLFPDEKLLCPVVESDPTLLKSLNQSVERFIADNDRTYSNKNCSKEEIDLIKRGIILNEFSLLHSHPLGLLRDAAFTAQRLTQISPISSPYEGSIFNKEFKYQPLNTLHYISRNNKTCHDFPINRIFNWPNGFILTDPNNTLTIQAEKYASPIKKEGTKSRVLIENYLYFLPWVKDPALDVIACHKNLQCQKLIEYFTESAHLRALSDEKTQNIFLLLLFQILSNSKAPKEPIFLLEIALKNEEFISLVQNFLQKAYTTYFDQENKPDFKTALFFAEVARRLRDIDQRFRFPDFKAKINHFLLQQDLAAEERILLHLHRILEYLPSKRALQMLSVEELSHSQELIEILVSWMHCSQINQNTLTWHLIHSYQEAKEFVFTLSPLLESLPPKLLQDLFSLLVPYETSNKNIIFSHQESSPFQESNPFIEFTKSLLKHSKHIANYFHQSTQKEEIISCNMKGKCAHIYTDGIWSIDVLHGTVTKKHERIDFSVESNLKNSMSYREFFGDSTFPIDQVGDVIVFQDSHQRAFRYFGENILQMKEQGLWYEYLPFTRVSSLKDKIPYPILLNSFVFFSQEGRLLFIDKIQRTISFRKDPTGALLDAENKRVFFIKDVHLPPSISSFESAYWVVVKQKDSFISMEFPRFSSLSNQPLSLLSSQEEVQWKDHEGWFLIESAKDFLGSSPNYLLLHHEEEGEKILVPLLKAKETKSFAPECELVRNDAFDPGNSHYHFLEYTIAEGKPSPSNAEGAFFLTYLFLQQRDYETAYRYLTDSAIRKYDSLSPISLQILSWVYDLTSSDKSAAMQAVVLKFSLFFLRNTEPQSLSEQEREATTKTISQIWISYKNNLDNAPLRYRFSLQEFKDFSHYAKKWGISLQVVSYQDLLKPILLSHHPINKEGATECLIRSNCEKSAFAEVYQEFASAKTSAEIVFLKIKHFSFLESYTGKLMRHILSIVSGEKRGPFPPFPAANAEREEIIKWLGTFEGIYTSNYLIPPSSHPSVFSDSKKLPLRKKTPLHEVLQAQERGKISTDFSLTSPSLERVSPLFSSLILEYFSSHTPQECAASSLDLSIQTSKDYEKTAQSDLQEVIEDYQEGKKQSDSTPQFTLQPGKNLQDLQEKLQGSFANITMQRQKVLLELTSLANPLPDDPERAIPATLLLQSNIKKAIDLDDLINAFLEGSPSAYADLNPHLSKEAIEKIHLLTATYLELSREKNQIQLALKIQKPSELGALLATPYAYDETCPYFHTFLVYEFRSGITMRLNQVELIEKMAEKDETGSYKHSISQLIMGGGKTSVLATNLLMLATKPGRIAFFIPPSTQFTTMRENLSNMEKKYFYREIIPIELKREDLSLKTLNSVKEKFQNAKNQQEIILTTKETVESLQLEFLSLLDNSDINTEKLTVLDDLLNEMQSVGDALGDEVDLLLNPRHETNFPIGEKELLEKKQVGLIQHVFRLLMEEEIESRLKLSKNQQGSLSTEVVKELLHKVAEKFFDSYQELSLEERYKEDFVDFLTQEKKESSFTPMLQEMAKDPKQKPLADQIALLKHLFQEVLPLTLQKSTGQHYGRVLGDEKVGPYNGVDNPAFTEFGSQWEAASYHMATALSQGVTTSQVEDFILGLFYRALDQAKIHMVSLENTFENILFQTVTGYSLADMKQENFAEKVALTLAKKPEMLLFLEGKTIEKLVGFYKFYYRATSQNFFAQFASFRGFSGTPWNFPSYPEELQQNLYLDRGTEGKIIDAYKKKAEIRPDSIHAVTDCNIQSILHSTLEKMPLDRRDRLSGFIDSAGFFKDFSNHKIAQEILAFYQEDPKIQTVLYFGRPSPKEAMTIMALRKGANKPFIVGSSQKEVLLGYGIKPESTFAYFDESHCEATDFPQKKDAINILSVGAQTSRRTFLQAIMRLRGYFTGQDLEFVLLEEELEAFLGNKENLPTHTEILAKTIETQAIRKADDTLRAYKQKIDHVIRQVPLAMILKARTLEEKKALFQQYRPVFTVEVETDLFRQFGQSKTSQDTMAILEKYREKKEALFMKLSGSDTASQEEMKKRLDAIVANAKSSSHLPSNAQLAEDDLLNTQVEVLQEVHTQTELQQNKELEQELQQELSLYLSEEEEHFREKTWKETDIINWLSKPYGEDPHAFYSASTLLNQYPYKYDYASLFSENLYFSHNFAHTVLETDGSFETGSKPPKLLPIFSPYQKPASQILLIREDTEYKVVLISSLEAEICARDFKKNPPNDMWLLLPSDHSIIPTFSARDRSKIADLLWEVHVINGNVEALLCNPKTPELKKKKDIPLLERFLLLKIMSKNDKTQLAIFNHYFRDASLQDLESLKKVAKTFTSETHQ
jgi:hypothetical protein